MSIIVIQIGQCGNQIGYNFFNTLSSYLDKKASLFDNKNQGINNKENKENVSNVNAPPWTHLKLRKLYQRFFNIPHDTTKKNLSTENTNTTTTPKLGTAKLKARAILVDSEIKVIRTIVSKTKGKTWQFNENNIYHEQIGAANNWSFGYYVHGSKAYNTISNRIKKEVENCEDFDTFLIIQSLAGGTGSGLGSYFTERLRKDYPYSSILNLAIWPYQTGEVVVQNYNIILSIAHLYKYSDAILLIYNSEFHSICSTRLNYKTVSFQHINSLISDTLVNIFLNKKPLPLDTMETMEMDMPLTVIDSINHKVQNARNFICLSSQAIKQKIRQKVTTRQLIQQICPLPQYKLLSLKFVPQTGGMTEQFNITNWNGLLRSLSQMALTDKPLDEKLNWNISVKKPYDELTNPYVHFIGNILILRGKGITPPSSSSSSESQCQKNLKTKKFKNRLIRENSLDDDYDSTREINSKKNFKLYKNYKDKKNDDPLELLSSQPYFNFEYPIPYLKSQLYTYYSHDTFKYSQSAYLISNSTSIIPKLEEVMEKVTRMYTTKAYIYQYNNYGLTDEHFEEILLEIEQSN